MIIRREFAKFIIFGLKHNVCLRFAVPKFALLIYFHLSKLDQSGKMGRLLHNICISQEEFIVSYSGCAVGRPIEIYVFQKLVLQR